MKISTIENELNSLAYHGRGIIIGKSADGKKAVTAYFIMGRSENSRNRVFIEQGDEIIIHPFDASKVEDPSLIIYAPVRVIGNNLIVTNGDQTDTIYDFVKDGKTFEQALETREFEPDSPNFTPRISGMMTFADGNFTFSYPALNGLGHFIHTYNHDGNPIPTFTGEPERVEIPDDIDAFTENIWANLNEQNKISLYVRYVDLATGEYEARMINKNK